MNAPAGCGVSIAIRGMEMPIFEYRCAACGKTSEFIEGVIAKEQPLLCPHCGSPGMTRLLSRGVGASKKEATGGLTCCDRTERCDRPPCGGEGRCSR